MTVFITKRRGTLALDRRKLQRRAQRLLKMMDLAESELSLLLTGDEEMRELNSHWRGKDASTDVLSFSQQEGAGAQVQSQVLGDVVICLDQAQRQAKRRKVELLDEIVVLLVHGVLHLVGYEHVGVSSAESRRMFRKQEKLLTLLLPASRNKK